MDKTERQEKLRQSWRSEFKTLGAEGVRREIALGRWPKEKLSVARQWLQLEDIHKWQHQAPASPPRSSKSLRVWAQYVGIAFAVLYAAARLFRLMRHGV